MIKKVTKVTKIDLKNATGIDTSKLALKSDLANLKSNLSKLSDVVKNDVIKISVYNNLLTKVNNIGTSGFALKAKYDAERKEYLGFTEKKIQIQKRKFLVLMGLLKIQIIMLKLLKKKTKCQLLVVQLQLLH